MSELIVKKEPCLTCPYRLDVPSGVWSFEEYEKLRLFDEGSEMPCLSTFLCHQSTVAGQQIACKGWLMVHRDSVAVCLACLTGQVDAETCFEEPEAELHESGNAAADFGQRDLKRPKKKALKVIDKLRNTGKFRE